MAIASGTVGALALAIAVGALISFFSRAKVDPREPPVLHPKIPFIGHIIGMLREGPLYFARLSARTNVPIFTLPVLNGKTYVCKSPSHAALIQRASSTLDFDQLIVEMTPRLVGLSKQCKKILQDPTAEQEGRVRLVTKAHDIINPPLRPQGMEGITAAHLEHFSDFINSIEDGQEHDLLNFTIGEITAASMSTFYGPNNPFAVDPSLIKAFWDWENGLITYMMGVLPTIFARKAYYSLERCVQGFVKYFEKDGIKDAATFLQDRKRLHEQDGISISDQARLELGLAFGFSGNASIVLFWLLNNIFSRPELMADLRQEIDRNALISPGTISFTKLRDACPLLNSVYRESARLVAPMTSARVVLEDTLIADTYLLRKDTIVQIAGGVLHNDVSIWGPDAGSFNARRFLYSQNGTKSNADGAILDSKGAQVHPAAYRAFGGGSSLCPGRHFAQMEIISLAAVLVYGFDVLPPEGAKEVAWNPPRDDTQFPIVVVKPLKKLKLKFRRRSGLEDVKWTLKV